MAELECGTHIQTQRVTVAKYRYLVQGYQPPFESPHFSPAFGLPALDQGHLAPCFPILRRAWNDFLLVVPVFMHRTDASLFPFQFHPTHPTLEPQSGPPRASTES